MIALAASLISLAGTTISLQPSAEPGSLADVVMQNILVNGPLDEGTYPLDLGNLSVGVTFDWDYDGTGSDAITVTPPDGVLCRPASCMLILPEDETGSVTLYEWVGF